jgi:hypothetical protein
MPVENIQAAFEHFKETIASLGRDAAVLKLAKTYSREEVSFFMEQINGREVAQEKFPSIAANEEIVYPPAYYLEQTSSEKTARFKAGIVSGETLIDMTGGFGIDAYFFAQKIKEVWYVEQDPVIYNIAAKNFPQLRTVNANSIEFLQQQSKKVDWLYLDPIRRTKDKRLSKVEEYSPNIIEHRELFFKHAHNIMVKLSPMTDIHQLVKLFPANKVYVLAIDNECKELLLVSDSKEHKHTEIESIHWIKDKEERFVSVLNEQHSIPLSDPLQYLYEPNAAIFKAHQYDVQAEKHALFKLHPNTHLYTLGQYHSSYEGRVYQIIQTLPFDAKSFQKGDAFNIKTRNFPQSPSEVAKKLGIKEGGDEFLFCVKTKDEFRLLRCSKL